MIRINLIKQEKRSEKKGLSLDIKASEMTKQLGYAAVFIITIGVCAYLWFSITSAKAEVERKIDQANTELNELKEVKDTVKRLEKEQAKLSLRRDVLTDLKENLRTPVEEISFIFAAHQYTEAVRFKSLTHSNLEEGGDQVVLTGEAEDEETNTFADILNKLAFVRSVDINRQVLQEFQLTIAFNQLRGFGKVPETDEETVADAAPTGGGH